MTPDGERPPYPDQDVRRLLPAAAASVTLLLAGCGNGAVLDPAALSNFLDLQVKNDTNKTVTIASLGFRDTLDARSARDEAAWLNARPGVAHVRVSSGGRTIGCLTIRYRKGQQHATALVSTAVPCRL